MNKKDQAALAELQAYLDSRDEKTNTQNDKLIISNSHAANKRAQDPAWLEKQRQRNREVTSRPEWLEKNAAKNKEMAKDKEWIKWRAEQMKAYANSEEGKKQRSTQQKKNWENHYESMRKGLQDRYDDGLLGKKISNSLKNSDACKENGRRHSNSIQTPNGLFESRKAAAEFYGIHPTAMNTRMKNHPSEYYYVEVRNKSTGYKSKKQS